MGCVVDEKSIPPVKIDVSWVIEDSLHTWFLLSSTHVYTQFFVPREASKITSQWTQKKHRSQSETFMDTSYK